MSAIYQELWDRVWQPCVDFAYTLAAATRSEGVVGSSTRMRVVELEDVGVDALPEAEASALYRGLRTQCRSGAVRDRG